jgi:hypothetical protein
MRFARVVPALGDIAAFDGLQYRPVSLTNAATLSGLSLVTSASAGTADRLPIFTGTGGSVQDSQISETISGGVVIFTGTLTGNRSWDFPDRSDTVAGLGAQTFTGNQTFSANITQTGSGTISTGTGAVSLNGVTTILSRLGIGAAQGTSHIAVNAGGLIGTSQSSVHTIGTISSAATVAFGYRSNVTTEAATFTLDELSHFAVSTNIVAGAGSTITRQAAFNARVLTGATNNIAYYSGSGGLLTGTGNWCAYFDTTRPNYLGTGATYIGTTAALNTDEILSVVKSTSATAAVTAGAVFSANSTGTAAAGFGLSHRFAAESSTTNDTSLADWEYTWATATHASRKARITGKIYDTAARTWLTVDTDGTIAISAFTGNVSSTGSMLSSSATLGIGYATGAGGTVTQITSRTTGVTLNKVCGAITLVSAAGSATYQSFTVTNSTVAATDTIIVNQKSGTDKNIILVTAVGAGSFEITFATTGGTTSEQPVFNFSVIKAVAA